MVLKEDLEIEELSQFAEEVIRSLGEQALSFYGKGRPYIRFDEGLVTEAELQLNGFFHTQLRARFPQHRVFGNAQEDREYTHGGERYVWIYDALDGVANFQAGIPIWGTSLTVLDNFWPIFGIFYMPVTGDLFYARAGDKAYRGDVEIHVMGQGNINDESVLLTYSRFHNHYRSTFPGKIRNLGCTIAHICYVATGRAEAAVIANETYQDLAAGRVIVEAAGGTISKMDGDAFSLDGYLDGERITESLLVAAPETGAAVLNCVHQNG